MRWTGLKIKYSSTPLAWIMLCAFAFMVCVLPFMHHHTGVWEAGCNHAAAVHSSGDSTLCLQSAKSISHKHQKDTCISCQWGLNFCRRPEAAGPAFTPPVRVSGIYVDADHLPGIIVFPCTQPRAPPPSIS
ncbi:MAG TPA: hypothetical protein DCL60_01135 [Armatimonadetes bacterium]|nr:hypothetical protein [Armatimonadota bacterium]